jgi:DNA-binding PadR family transcriptional regulator
MENKQDKTRTQKKFDTLDIIRIFLLIGKYVTINRKDLSLIGEIGEGSVRTILDTLSEKNLIIRRKKGNELSELGKNIFNNLIKIFTLPKKVKADVFKDGYYAYASVLRKYEKKKIKSLYKARDFAIRAGCNSAMVLICTKKSIKIPYVRKWDFNILREEFSVIPGDLIIITSAVNRRISEKGILAIIKYLSDEVDRLTKNFYEN